MLFSQELQRRLTAARAGTIATAAHPGFSSTEFYRNMPALLRPASRSPSDRVTFPL
ncbi:hypothetical protein ACFQ07_01785 [Actinomadura adrarensis]|uniref:Uncharacterized protein n=1 Tax=Actinomadura adrarensis TaxID=1819600 RepID=A0ABW3CAU1_9ACTN